MRAIACTSPIPPLFCTECPIALSQAIAAGAKPPGPSSRIWSGNPCSCIRGAATASGNAVETSVSARAGYLVLDNLLIDIGGTFANYDFGAIGRTDKYYGFDLGAKYFFTPNFYVGPRYYYSTRQSTDPLAGFNDNRILLTLGARL